MTDALLAPHPLLSPLSTAPGKESPYPPCHPEMRWARLIYGQQFASSAAPLLILHGLFGSSRNWQTIGAVLAARLARPVVAFDLPNHGKSAQESSSWDTLTEQLGQEIHQTAEELAPLSPKGSTIRARPVLMGHSLGGQVAMQALFRRPNLPIDHLILVDISPEPMQFATSPMNRYLEAMQTIEGLGLSSRGEAMRCFQQQVPETSEALRQFLFTNWGKRPTTAAGEREEGFLIPLKAIKESMLRLSQTHKYPSVPLALPTLFIRGARSNYVTDANMPLIKRCFANFRVVTIPQAGHWLHYEAPEDFTSAVHDAIQ